jgi:hypothetical protein
LNKKKTKQNKTKTGEKVQGKRKIKNSIFQNLDLNSLFFLGLTQKNFNKSFLNHKAFFG